MNWKNEAVERLGQYSAMSQAMKTIPVEMERLEREACLIKARKLEQPTATSKGPMDDRLIDNLIQRQELGDAFENARCWLAATNGALSVLKQEERDILYQMYVHPSRGVVAKLCEELGVEQSSVYRKRDQALYRFTMALYGNA